LLLLFCFASFDGWLLAIGYWLLLSSSEEKA
jgi:hypothetical protein